MNYSARGREKFSQFKNISFILEKNEFFKKLINNLFKSPTLLRPISFPDPQKRDQSRPSTKPARKQTTETEPGKHGSSTPKAATEKIAPLPEGRKNKPGRDMMDDGRGNGAADANRERSGKRQIAGE